jgi:hypothetical protein
VAKVLGEFPWHSHEHEDEMFLVLRGELRIGRAEADGGAVLVRPGEFFVVPRGVRHNTAATEETWIALVETVTTLHTGAEQTPLRDRLRISLAYQNPNKAKRFALNCWCSSGRYRFVMCGVAPMPNILCGFRVRNGLGNPDDLLSV